MTKESRTFLVLLVLCIGLIISIKYIFSLVAPFMLGAIFACLIEPLVRRMEKNLGMRRQWAVILLITGLVWIIFTMLAVTLVLLYQEAQKLLPRVSLLAQEFSLLESKIARWIFKFIPDWQGDFSEILFFREFIDRLLRSILNKGIHLAPLFPKVITSIALGGAAAYFFSRDKEAISRWCYRILPVQIQERVNSFKSEVIDGLAKFIRTEFILVLLTAFLTTFLFWMLGFSGALGYGLLTGFLDLIPVLGPGMIYIPAVIFAILFHNYQLALFLGMGFFLIITLRQVVELKLLGENFNVHPLVTIFVIYVGMKIFGLAGIFLGPFLLIILRGYYRVAVAKRVTERL